MPQLEPTLIQHMLRNIAVAIGSMESELPGLEVNGLNLNNIQTKERKARVSFVIHSVSLSLSLSPFDLRPTQDEIWEGGLPSANLADDGIHIQYASKKSCHCVKNLRRPNATSRKIDAGATLERR